jgi:hypothetical protein
MHTLSTLSVVVSLSVAAAAQSNVGINLFRGNVTLSGVLCGFNCASSTNTGRAAAAIGDTIGIRLLGQDQFPAAVLLGVGPAISCPGVAIPGVGNTLLVDLASLVVVASTGTLTGPARSNCGETANQALFVIPLPPVARGTLVHFQGLVFDAGAPAFTRPIELTI